VGVEGGRERERGCEGEWEDGQREVQTGCGEWGRGKMESRSVSSANEKSLTSLSCLL
jgi:hypothetical protein